MSKVDALHERGYTVERELGRGGMGVVLLATQRSLGRPVAIKLLDGDRVTPADLARFRREALALRKVEHPSVVRVLDVALDATPPFLVLEYVAGARALEEAFDELPPDLLARQALARAILEGLAAVHRLGIVHRDLKPGNVLVDPQSHPRLIDFGLARTLASDETRHTRDGQVMGTLAYMSPEQLRGEDTGLASDVYSFALLAMEVLAGRRLFTNAAPLPERCTYIDRMGSGVPSVLRFAPVAPALARLLSRCTHADVAERPPSAEAVLAEWPEHFDATARRGPATAVIAPPDLAGPRAPAVPHEPVSPRAARGAVTARLAIPAPLAAAPVVAAPPASPARGPERYLAGIALAVALAAAWAAGPRHRVDPPPPEASTAAAEPAEIALVVSGANVEVRSHARTPTGLSVRWMSKDGPRAVERPAAADVTVSVPAGEVTTGFEIRSGERLVDRAALVQPRLKRLAELLGPVDVPVLFRRVAAAGARGRAHAAGGEVVELLPAGAVAALRDLGPLLGPAVAWVDDPALELALASRLDGLESVEAYALRRSVALATHVAPWLPAGWAQRIDAPDDPALARYNLKAQQSKGTSHALVNGAKPEAEWWATGEDWDYLNWAGKLVQAPAPIAARGDGVFEAPATAAEQSCTIRWELPAEVPGRRARLLFSVELSAREDMGLWVEINRRLSFPLLTRGPRGGRADAAWFLSRFVPVGALAAGPNQVRIRAFALPHADASSAWIGGVSFIGSGRRFPK